MKKYFVIKNKKEFLWKDDKFYPAFVKEAFAVDEEKALVYKELGYDIEYASPDVWQSLYDEKLDTKDDSEGPMMAPPENFIRKNKRRTYVRCSTFTLACALDRLYDDENVRNVWVSMEDGDFLISFDYIRDYERFSGSSGDCANTPNN